MWILGCPFFHAYDTLKEWAADARERATKCSSIAKEQTASIFLTLIEQSLEEGDGWLHRYAKNYPELPHTIFIEAETATDDSPVQPRRYISDPNELLRHHAATWKGHWKSDDVTLCEETIRVISNNILLITGDTAP